jgi:glutamyl-tRNA synthetase
MKISHVIRGEEWLPSAPLHVMLYRYLGWEDSMPTFAHLPLLLKPEGNGKLSKRDGDRLGFPVFPLEWTSPEGETSSGYRESGYLPEAVLNILALLGWHPSDNQEVFSMEELIQAFSLEKVSKSGAKFDIAKAKWFNHKYIQTTSDSDLLELMRVDMVEAGIDANDEFVLKVIGMMKEKIDFTSELLEQSMFFFKAPTSYDEKTVRKKWKGDIPGILSEYADNLEAMADFKQDAIKTALENLAEKHEKGVGSIMQPLRVAVSGNAGGPPIFEMLELIGQEEIVSRLRTAISSIDI